MTTRQELLTLQREIAAKKLRLQDASNIPKEVMVAEELHRLLCRLCIKNTGTGTGGCKVVLDRWMEKPSATQQVWITLANDLSVMTKPGVDLFDLVDAIESAQKRSSDVTSNRP